MTRPTSSTSTPPPPDAFNTILHHIFLKLCPPYFQNPNFIGVARCQRRRLSSYCEPASANQPSKTTCLTHFSRAVASSRTPTTPNQVSKHTTQRRSLLSSRMQVESRNVQHDLEVIDVGGGINDALALVELPSAMR
ncbi:unnamed protein product [Cyclocybe aegerita]|uniref:Uncharacterized protein n=1 Tax=Cyclocybe aegerita TaxID=1973307 RepID=A0A8S0XQZ4_CYCAE|nr:unnamed protein product [Cyclocybe aegerita]